MEPIRKLKSILSKDKKENLIQFDYWMETPKGYLLSGWIASKSHSVNESDLRFTKAGDVDICFYQRTDVSQHLALDVSHTRGFIVFLGKVGSLSGIEVQYNSVKKCVDLNDTIKTTSTSDFIGQALGSPELVIDFFDSVGLSVDLADSGSNKVKLDKDLQNIKKIVSSLSIHAPDFKTIAVQDILPKLHKVWRRRISKPNNVEVIQYGSLSAQPRVSLIIPIYGRYDFVQHQIAQFSSDDQMREAEVIYVLDDPKLEHEFKVKTFGIYETFQFPFKIVLSQINLGFSGANNLGVRFAAAPNLLLMNSDILPSSPEWLESYISSFESKNDAGIMGALLVYEDDSIQHAGMEFKKDVTLPSVWINHHTYKGYPKSLLAGGKVEKVQATTGACMMITKALFESVGGFNDLYVVGDFEDSDLCLKVRKKGLEIYCDQSICFYHLERLSQDLVNDDNWKQKLTLVNGAYHSHQWDEMIKNLAVGKE